MDNSKNNSLQILAGALVLLALIFSGAFFLSARSFSKQASFVEVKGLSERIVKADVAIWSINFEAKSNNVDALYADIERNLTVIRSFLSQKGFETSEINVAPVNIYQDTYRDALFRYNANIELSVYTKKVDQVRSASQDTLAFIKQGVTLTQNSISFEFSDLNSIKPEMLAEAIANAKVSAEEFAKASGSAIGEIARGNQGVFDITEKDPGSPEYKKIRVVSTLRFLLR